MAESISSVGYHPGTPPDQDDLQRYLSDELQKIAAEIDKLRLGHLDVSHVIPVKPRIGDVRYADGTNWNPGLWEGYYVFNSDEEWKYIGGGADVFGTPPDYSEFEDDGTLVAHGEASCWDDVVGSLTAQRLESTSGKLNYNWTENTITMQSGGSLTTTVDRLMFNQQFPHKARVGSEMRLHIHWEQVSSNQIEWSGQYRIQNNGAAKTTPWTSFSADSATDSVFPYVSGTLNQITELVAVDMTGASISATLEFRLARTDSTTGDIEATFVDSHYEIDTAGSREEYVK